MCEADTGGKCPGTMACHASRKATCNRKSYVGTHWCQCDVAGGECTLSGKCVAKQIWELWKA